MPGFVFRTFCFLVSILCKILKYLEAKTVFWCFKSMLYQTGRILKEDFLKSHFFQDYYLKDILFTLEVGTST